MLLQQPVEILHLSARALGDTPLAATLDKFGVAALLGRHGVDHHLHLREHFGIEILLRHLGHIAHAGQFIQHARHAAHTVHLLQLVAKILQIKLLALLYLAGEFGGLLLVDLLLDLFDQRQHIAHTQNTRGQPVGVEGVQRGGLLAHTEEFDRLARYRAH